MAEAKAEVVEKLELVYHEITACWLLEILRGYSDIAVQNNIRSLNNRSTEWYRRHIASKQKTETKLQVIKTVRFHEPGITCF